MHFILQRRIYQKTVNIFRIIEAMESHKKKNLRFCFLHLCLYSNISIKLQLVSSRPVLKLNMLSFWSCMSFSIVVWREILQRSSCVWLEPGRLDGVGNATRTAVLSSGDEGATAFITLKALFSSRKQRRTPFL